MPYSFTAYGDVRAILGVSAKELPDATLALNIFQKQLLMDFETASEDVVADYLIAAALVSPTAVQTAFVRAFEVAAVYLMSSVCVTGLPSLSLRTITDGKASMSRQAGVPYRETADSLECRVFQYQRALQEAHAAYLGLALAALSPVLSVGSSVPSYDPVVDE